MQNNLTPHEFEFSTAAVFEEQYDADDLRMMERESRQATMSEYEKFLDDEGFEFGPDGSFCEKEAR